MDTKEIKFQFEFKGVTVTSENWLQVALSIEQIKDADLKMEFFDEFSELLEYESKETCCIKVCDTCGKFMVQGYFWDGAGWDCSEKCLLSDFEDVEEFAVNCGWEKVGEGNTLEDYSITDESYVFWTTCGAADFITETNSGAISDIFPNMKLIELNL